LKLILPNIRIHQSVKEEVALLALGKFFLEFFESIDRIVGLVKTNVVEGEIYESVLTLCGIKFKLYYPFRNSVPCQYSFRS